MPRNILPVRNGSFRLQKLNFSNRGFMDISMPPDFPLIDFRAFGIAAQSFFPKLLSDEDLNDPQEKLRHFQWAWQAVRYRYRLCYDSSEEFSALLINPNEARSKGGIDEELSYKLERCIYVFFISGVSIFDRLAFCLYFFGNALRPTNFRYVDGPKKITLKATTSAFATSFGQANITDRLRELSEQPEFTALEQWRNILAHRLPIGGAFDHRAPSFVMARMNRLGMKLVYAWPRPKAHIQRGKVSATTASDHGPTRTAYLGVPPICREAIAS
jgi:hypothetical protein